MDKSETIDEMFFNPESFTTEGKEFLNQMKVFREGVAEILKDNLSLQCSNSFPRYTNISPGCNITLTPLDFDAL